MTTDLENLLRDTMRDRAQTLTEAPPWAGRPPRRTRTGWVVMGAAAATVVAVAGGGTLLAGGLGRDRQPGGVASESACMTSLPADWRTALTRTEPLYGGEPVFPAAYLGPDALVGTVQHDGATEVVLRTAAATTTLATVPANRLVTRIDADGRWVVVSTAPDAPADNPDSAVDRITVFDTRGGAPVDAHSPAGVVQGHGAVVQDGQVYWVSGTTPRADSGTVERFDLRTREYATVGRTQGSTEIDHDVRGVGWPGGSVPAADAPSGVPGFFRAADGGPEYAPVFSDGTDMGWQDGPTSTVLHWADADGVQRSWTVDLTSLPEVTPSITAVSGPFVFFALGNVTDVLDTRTGAVAELGDGLDVTYPAFVTRGRVDLMSDVDRPTRRLEPAGLSRLTCR